MLVNNKSFLEMTDMVAQQTLIEVLLDQSFKRFYVIGMPKEGNKQIGDLILAIRTETHKRKGFPDQEVYIDLLPPVAFTTLDKTAQPLHFFIERRQSDLLGCVIQQQPNDINDLTVHQPLVFVPCLRDFLNEHDQICKQSDDFFDAAAMPRWFFCKIGLKGNNQLDCQLQGIGTQSHLIALKASLREVEDKVIHGPDHR